MATGSSKMLMPGVKVLIDTPGWEYAFVAKNVTIHQETEPAQEISQHGMILSSWTNPPKVTLKIELVDNPFVISEPDKKKWGLALPEHELKPGDTRLIQALKETTIYYNPDHLMVIKT